MIRLSRPVTRDGVMSWTCTICGAVFPIQDYYPLGGRHAADRHDREKHPKTSPASTPVKTR